MGEGVGGEAGASFVLGNSIRIVFHRTVFTFKQNPAVTSSIHPSPLALSPGASMLLHFGHFGLYLNASLKHRRQKLCPKHHSQIAVGSCAMTGDVMGPQGVEQGLMQISRQIEQVSSSFNCLRSTPALKARQTCDNVWRRQSILTRLAPMTDAAT